MITLSGDAAPTWLWFAFEFNKVRCSVGSFTSMTAALKSCLVRSRMSRQECQRTESPGSEIIQSTINFVATGPMISRLATTGLCRSGRQLPDPAGRRPRRHHRQTLPRSGLCNWLGLKWLIFPLLVYSSFRRPSKTRRRRLALLMLTAALAQPKKPQPALLLQHSVRYCVN